MKRIPIGNGKYAFEQTDEALEAALPHIIRIERAWRAPHYFYHFRRGGHVAAIRRHLSNQWFGKLDLRRFFEQVTRNRIIKRLTAIGYCLKDAESFAILSTVNTRGDGKFVLPFGFVQSPLLASLDMDKSEFGRALAQLRKADKTVTVYVDDVIVSDACEAGVNEALDELRTAAALTHYQINEEKSQAARQTVTAFNIDLTNGDIAVNAKRLAEFETNIMKAGYSIRSDAILAYIKSVNPSQAAFVRESHGRCFPKPV